MKIRILNEKKLTKKDKRQKEKYVKGMKSKKKDFQKRYGDDAEDVMYATATNMAKKRRKNNWMNYLLWLVEMLQAPAVLSEITKTKTKK